MDLYFQKFMVVLRQFFNCVSRKSILLCNSRALCGNTQYKISDADLKRLKNGFFNFKIMSAIEKKDKKAKKAEKGGGEGGAKKEAMPPPDFLAKRLELWDKFKLEREAFIASQERKAIKITLPDGKVLDGTSWETTPYQLAQGISQGLADSTVVCKVNDVLWDLERPLETDATLQLLKFDESDEAKSVFWHSTAHMLGEAIECHTGGHLCYGPPITDGFYYDVFIPGEDSQGPGQTIKQEDFKPMEDLMKSYTKQKQPFERLVLTKEQLLEMFAYNEFKCRIIRERIKEPSTTVYRNGTLIDLCRGPHVRHTGKIKALTITKNSSSFWEGNAEAEVLQRVYGISFPDTKNLKEWKTLQEEAAKRDHRKIGLHQELFFFHDLSPGSCFFLPKGAHIYNTLMAFMREQYRLRGYEELISPNIFNSRLWQTSGHWDLYKDNIYSFGGEKVENKEIFALKPMNCPGHCLMYLHRPRSHRELPIRWADFGVLHRNELHGALHGLTRVRRFQQDDGHIFCRQEQIKQEIKNTLDFLDHVYGVFGFTYKLNLSTRPEKFLGEIATWDAAETQLKESLDEFCAEKNASLSDEKQSKIQWILNPADGAFYGPKIDITVMDALKRSFQCATIQLDFQQPQRFGLTYITGNEAEPSKPPVIIHRAILGSVERMFAILTESFAGKWPFWLSPRQICIIPVHENAPLPAYAAKVRDLFARENAYQVILDTESANTLNKKIREAQLAQFNFILVIGEREAQHGTVNVRTRDNKEHGEFSLQDVLKRFDLLSKTRTNDAEDKFKTIVAETEAS